jgi:hypothetical protein
LANNLAARNQGTVHFFSLNDEVLGNFKITSEDDFEKMFLKYEERYKKEGME